MSGRHISGIEKELSPDSSTTHELGWDYFRMKISLLNLAEDPLRYFRETIFVSSEK